jgi:polyhydroxyalkanoate synthesis regulator phasin
LAKSGQVDEIVAVMLDCMNNRSEDLIKSRLRELARIEKNVMFPLNVSLQIEMELTTLAKKGVTPQVKKRSLEQLIKKMLNDNEGLLGCVQSVYEQQVKMLNTQAEHTLRESPVAKKLMGLMSELGRQLPKNVSIQVFSGRLDDLKKLVTLSPGSDRQTVEKVYQEVVARGHLTAQEAEEIRQAWQSLPQSVAETDVTTLYQIFRKVLGYGAELHLVEKTATLESETVSDLI